MKKTIIVALLAGALSAHAVDINNQSDADAFFSSAVYQNLNVTTATSGTLDISELWGEKTDNSFTLTATLNVEKLASYIGATATETRSPLMYATGSYTIGMAMGTADTFNGVSGAFYNTNNEWKYNFPFDEWATSPNPGSLSAINLADVTAAAVTFSHDDKNTSRAYLTLVRDSGTTTYYGSESGLKFSTSGVGNLTSITFNTDLITSVTLMAADCGQNVGLVNEAAIAAVPEPTTATLSLLALVGLAARRRRK